MLSPGAITCATRAFCARLPLNISRPKKLRAIIDLKLAFVLVVCIIGGLDACTSVAFRSEANTFTSAYGDVLNEQMLLNLARLDNSHPAYFIAVGTLNSKWSMGAGAEGGLNSSEDDTTTRKISHKQSPAPSPNTATILNLAERALETVQKVTFGGTAKTTLAGSVTPEFTLIPLGNDQIAQQVLNPTRQQIFFTLYEQGYPIDLLMRVLVEEIQVKLPSVELVLRNDPTGDDADHHSYAGFLTVCYMARNLQRAGLLKIDKAEPPDSSAPKPKSEALAQPKTAISKEPDPWVLLETKKAGGQWTKTDAGWELGDPPGTRYVFKLNTKLKQYAGDQLDDIGRITQIMTEGAGKVDDDIIEAMLSILGVTGPGTGFAAGSNAAESKNEKKKNEDAFLVLRSYSRVLHAVAHEQNVFPNHTIPRIPDAERRYVIKTKNWDSDMLSKKYDREIGAVNYEGTRYAVKDVKGSTWNRDVFRLLVALNSQVAVDISKFQRQVLEVR